MKRPSTVGSVGTVALWSSKANEVCSNDDLLIEILLRLPLISLRLFKSVSKRWLSLIDDPDFTLRRSKNSNLEPPAGLFLQQQTNSFVFAFVHFDSRIPVKQSPLITLFKFEQDSRNIVLLCRSCNGLLLCCIWPDKKLYVYNPTTNLFKLIPSPHVWDPLNEPYGMVFAFDPSLSPHYKLVYVANEFDDNIEIYSSETGNWTVSAQTFSQKSSPMAFDDGVYWHDAFHWISYACEIYHLKLDLENPHLIHVDTPKTLNGEAYGEDDKLAVSCDCLLLLQMVGPLFSLQMNVFEMKNDYSGWSVKYCVNLAHITTTDSNFFHKKQPVSVLFIVLGEREEESFLVLEVSGKLIQYNIMSRAFHELCDLASIRTRDDSDFNSFLFSPSLASV